jgi:hypothetical protein
MSETAYQTGDCRYIRRRSHEFWINNADRDRCSW